MSPGPGATPATAEGGVLASDHWLLRGLLAILAVAASLTPIRNYDYWWHLATGAWILEHRAVPRADPFSFTAAGTSWIDHEWLFQVLALLAHRALGPEALVALKVCLVLLLCAVLVRHLEQEGHGPAGAAVLLAPALAGAAFRFDVRPELTTLLCAPIVLALVLRARRTGSARPLWMVPLLTALWANLHVGVVVAPAFLGLGLLGTLVAARVPWLLERNGLPVAVDPRFVRRLAAATCASALAVGANPYGFSIYAQPFVLRHLLHSLPWPNLEWLRPDPALFPLFYICAAASLVVTCVAVRRLDPVTVPALLLAAALGVAHLRNIGLFFVLLPLGMGRPARALIDALQRTRVAALGTIGGRVRPGFIAAAVILVVSVPLVVLLPPGLAWGAGVASDNEPAAAADFLAREGVGTRLFNDVRFGGYLIWRRFPGRQVFIDGRNEIYGPLLKEIAAAMGGPTAWTDLIAHHRIDAAFLRYPPTLQKVVYPAAGGDGTMTGERAFSAAYFPKTLWALVYWDDDAMIFLRRVPEYEEVIARLEYRAIQPDDWQFLIAGVVRGAVPVAPILEELRRKLGEDPACRRARGLYAYFGPLAGPAPGPAPPGDSVAK